MGTSYFDQSRILVELMVYKLLILVNAQLVINWMEWRYTIVVRCKEQSKDWIVLHLFLYNRECLSKTKCANELLRSGRTQIWHALKQWMVKFLTAMNNLQQLWVDVRRSPQSQKIFWLQSTRHQNYWNKNPLIVFLSSVARRTMQETRNSVHKNCSFGNLSFRYTHHCSIKQAFKCRLQWYPRADAELSLAPNLGATMEQQRWATTDKVCHHEVALLTMGRPMWHWSDLITIVMKQ